MQSQEAPLVHAHQGVVARRQAFGHPNESLVLWRRAALDTLPVFLTLRILLLILGLVAVTLFPHGEAADVPGREAPAVAPGLENIFGAWERWDALWYLRIVTDGYVADDGSAAFFPLYPLVVRSVDAVVGDALLSSLIVSNLAAYAALVLLYVLVTHEWGAERARRAVLYLAIFPTSFFLLAPYSESLFLALALATMLAARRGRWAWAGAAGAAAAATRSLGVLLVLVLAVEAWHQARDNRDRSGLWRVLPWAGVPAVGFLAYTGWWWITAGDPTVPFSAQANWSRVPLWPFETLWLSVEDLPAWLVVPNGGYFLLDLLIAIPALAAALWVAFRLRPLYAVFVWSSLLVALTFVWDGRPLMSMPRFVLVLFPIHVALALWAERMRGLHEAIVAVSAGLLTLTAVLFLNWYYMF